MKVKVRVLLADDRSIVHEGIRDVCEYGGNIDLVEMDANC